ncbi:efflux RND transporter periplasmic adaptor subunit, partial [Bacteroidota bacterium]
AEKNYNRMRALLDAGETSQANFDGVETQYLVAKRNFETQKQMMFVEAPFDGTVTSIMVKEGDNVKSKAALFSVIQLNKMRTRVWATENEIGLIKNGMDAFLEFMGNKYFGKVVERSMAMDPMKQAYYVDIEFNNRKKELKSGPTVNVSIIVYENQEAIVIPRNLIKQDTNGQFVFIEENGAAEKRYVTNGNDSGIDFEISSGLILGDNLIVKGSSQLINGTKVKVTQ